MKYSEAKKELQNILQKLQQDEVDIDSLEALIQRANFLIENCQKELRGIESKINTTESD